MSGPDKPFDLRNLPLVGLIEIAQRAGVQRPVVSMWRTRHVDFPRPVKELHVGPVFWWPEVQSWLKQTGRSWDADWTVEQVMQGKRDRNSRLRH